MNKFIEVLNREREGVLKALKAGQFIDIHTHEVRITDEKTAQFALAMLNYLIAEYNKHD